MIDDESGLPAERSAANETLLYDYFKHLTSLALLTLGGVLGLAQAGNTGDVKPALLIIVLLFISLGGICSFAGASEIVRSCYTGEPSKSLELYRRGAPALLAIGIGMFLGIFANSLV